VIYKKTIGQKQKLLEDIDALDKCDDYGVLQEDMKMKRIQLLNELSSMNEKEINMLNQKAIIEWIKKGDTNFKFFHSRIK